MSGKIELIVVGKLKETYLTDACKEYQKRLTSYVQVQIIELEEYRLSADPTAAQIEQGLAQEGKAILARLSPTAYKVALCVEGRMYASEELSTLLQRRQLQGDSTFQFVIGGSYGLSTQVKKSCDLQLSFSPMTFPHQLMRVMLLEQLYRAMSLLHHGKYHK